VPVIGTKGVSLLVHVRINFVPIVNERGGLIIGTRAFCTDNETPFVPITKHPRYQYMYDSESGKGGLVIHTVPIMRPYFRIVLRVMRLCNNY